MRFRLLKPMCRIWDASCQETQEQGELPPILPAVFYQGEGAWQHFTEFADLIFMQERERGSLPHFAYHLIDQSGLAPEAITGGRKARVAQLLMMAVVRAQVQEAPQIAALRTAQLTHTGGVPCVAVFVRYLAATQERRVANESATQGCGCAPIQEAIC